MRRRPSKHWSRQESTAPPLPRCVHVTSEVGASRSHRGWFGSRKTRVIVKAKVWRALVSDLLGASGKRAFGYTARIPDTATATHSCLATEAYPALLEMRSGTRTSHH